MKEWQGAVSGRDEGVQPIEPQHQIHYDRRVVHLQTDKIRSSNSGRGNEHGYLCGIVLCCLVRIIVSKVGHGETPSSGQKSRGIKKTIIMRYRMLSSALP